MRGLNERDVTGQISSFLQWKGWRELRNNVTRVKDSYGHVTAFGEIGMPDKLFIYYLKGDKAQGDGLILWVEFKNPNYKRNCPSWCRSRSVTGKKQCSLCNQRDWKRREESRGAVVVTTDNYEEFKAWYQEKYGWLHGPDAPRRGTQTEFPVSLA